MGSWKKIPEFNSSKIPEEMLHSKQEQANLQKNSFSKGSDEVLSLGRGTIGVNDAETFPFSQLQENPHGPMLINSAFNASETSQKIEMTHHKPEQAALKPQELAQTSIEQETECTKRGASASMEQQPQARSPLHGTAETSKKVRGRSAELNETTGPKGKEPSPKSITATNHKLDYIPGEEKWGHHFLNFFFMKQNGESPNS